MRNHTVLDQLLTEADRALRTLAAPQSLQHRPLPQAEHDTTSALSDGDKKHIAGLMRINHAGEVAAQALYFGHAAFAKTTEQRAHMLEAAKEEGDHLAWCAQRLSQLDARPSWFGPLWYGGAYALGAASAMLGDRFALSFVAETEKQVEAHLQDHQTQLSADDPQSQAILEQMRADERAHGEAATAKGGQSLPWPVPNIMQRAADVMRSIAYRI